MTNENGGIPGKQALKKTLKQVQGEPTESEEWMLNLLDFFLFLFKKLHYRLVEVLRGMLL